jgi:predicted transcriptional regulator of viral defense system
VFRTDLLRDLPNVSPEALRKSIYRQQKAGRLAHVSRGADHWLIVPFQDALIGSPPLEVWLDPYLCKTLGIPYYVGLLSAAETYGSSPYGVMITQVVVEQKRLPIIVGRHKIVFYTCTRIEAMPVRWHETPDGKFKVSTPELTILNLIQRSSKHGGISRVRAVLDQLWPLCTHEGLTDALNALQNVPVAQRLGALITIDDQTDLIEPLLRWLQDKPMRLVPLEDSLPPKKERIQNTLAEFKVWIPLLHPSNT